MSRLLVVSYHFPPDTAVGGQRWAGLSKYLARLGWEVHVVTAADAPAGQTPAGIHRHVVPRRRTLNDRYNAARQRRAVSVAAAGGGGGGGSEAAVHPSMPTSPLGVAIAAVRRLAGLSLVFPDYSRGWLLRAAGTIGDLLSRHQFDLIVSSGPPHLSHFAVMIANAGRGVPHVVDMRDPWAVAHERNTPHENFFITRGERVVLGGLERLFFAAASKIVVNTREFTAEFKKSRPDLDIEWFPNGVDVEQLPARDPNAVRTGSMAHVGALYAGRNLSSVFAALHDLIAEHPEMAGKFRIDLAGPIDQPHRDAMSADLDARGLGGVVQVHGMLPRTKALELLHRSHVALVLAQNQKMMVPAKLYESVGLGVPTLVIAEKDSAAWREGQRIGAMPVEGDDLEGLKRVLRDMLAGRIPPRMDAITPITYDKLAVQMDRLLRGVIARG